MRRLSVCTGESGMERNKSSERIIRVNKARMAEPELPRDCR